MESTVNYLQTLHICEYSSIRHAYCIYMGWMYIICEYVKLFPFLKGFLYTLYFIHTVYVHMFYCICTNECAVCGTFCLLELLTHGRYLIKGESLYTPAAPTKCSLLKLLCDHEIL